MTKIKAFGVVKDNFLFIFPISFKNWKKKLSLSYNIRSINT